MGKNDPIDVPIFDIAETGRVDLTLYKLDTGFMLRDNDRKKDHSVKMDDLDASLDLLVDSIKAKLKSLMNDKGKFDFIDIAFIVQEGEDAGEMYDLEEPDQPQTVNMDPNQLADLINDLLQDSPMKEFPSRMGHRSIKVIDGNMIMRAMNSPRNIVKLRTRVKDTKGDRTDNLQYPKKDKKFFFDKTKNRPVDDIKSDQNRNKGEDNEPNKII